MDISELATKVTADPALAARIQADAPREIARLARENPAYMSDTWTYRLVVIFLGTAVLSVVVGAVALFFATDTTDLPSGVIAIASASVGALAGLLAPTPGESGRH